MGVLMFENKIKPIDWSSLIGGVRTFKVTSFQKKGLQTWEQYVADSREYWCADIKDGPGRDRFVHAFGKSGKPEEEFNKYCKKGFADYNEFCNKWLGLFSAGEIVYLTTYAPGQLCLLMSADKNNRSLRDHKDLEIWIQEEITPITRKRVALWCVGYTSGTIAVTAGSVENMMGESVGGRKIHHQQFRTRNVSFNGTRLVIDDAVLTRL